MRFLRRIAGFLGFVKDEAHEIKEEDDEDLDDHSNRPVKEEIRGPRKGFSVPVQVSVERPGPVLIPCSHNDGGIQGLRWYAKRLRIDEDGDVADEFLDEIRLETSSGLEDHRRPLPLQRFEVKYNARRAKVKKQVMSLDGKIQQCVEYQGRLQWV